MKRAGFTMIELIFVIVILGILSAVALPKFVGVSEQANVGKAGAYIGTLNRTVAPALWADSLAKGGNGDVMTRGGALDGGVLASDMDLQIEVPDIGTPLDKLNSFDLTACTGTAGQSALLDAANIGDADPTDAGNGSTFTVGTTQYGVRCTNGTNTEAPRFWLVNVTNGNTIKVK